MRRFLNTFYFYPTRKGKGFPGLSRSIERLANDITAGASAGLGGSTLAVEAPELWMGGAGSNRGRLCAAFLLPSTEASKIG